MNSKLSMKHAHAPITPTFPSSSSHENAKGFSIEIDVGPSLVTLLLQPEMLTEGARSGQCGQPGIIMSFLHAKVGSRFFFFFLEGFVLPVLRSVMPRDRE